LLLIYSISIFNQQNNFLHQSIQYMFVRNFILMILFFIASVNICVAQNPQYYVHDANRINPMYGSAKELKGKIYVINCFVSDDKRGWKADEKKLKIAEEAEGLGWIQWYKKDWGITDISFDIFNMGLEQDIKVEKIERAEDLSKPKSLAVPIVMKAAGYNDLAAFYDSVKNATQADNIVVIIFAKKASRSYALPSNSNNKSSDRFLEGAIVFRETYYEKPSSASTIIHEMLHLFGARDIYHDKQIDRDSEIEKKMTTVFPNSIMLEGSNMEIGDLRMDQLTVWCIGWSHSYWGWYDYFGPLSRLKK